jgi:hypothetical protein
MDIRLIVPDAIEKERLLLHPERPAVGVQTFHFRDNSMK